MKVAILEEAALVSSAVFEMVRALSSSSRTLTDFWFSDLVLAAFEGARSIASTEGIISSSS